MDVQVGDIWSNNAFGNVRVIAVDLCHGLGRPGVAFAYWEDGIEDVDSKETECFANNFRLMERDGQPVEPAKQGPKIERREIVREPEFAPKVLIDNTWEHVHALVAKERLHGYVYERPDGDEEISALPFMFKYDDDGLSPRDHGGMPRVLPSAVMVEV